MISHHVCYSAQTKYGDEYVGGEGWGRRKKSFYGGNPNEQGGSRSTRRAEEGLRDSDLSEAELEAQESAKLQLRQLEAMDEGDFMGAFAAVKEDKKKKKSEKVRSKFWFYLDKKVNLFSFQKPESDSAIKLDASKLSKKERARLFAKEAPEFAAVVEDFGEKMLEAAKLLAPIAEAVDRGDIPEGRLADYIKLKYEVVLR